MVLLMSPIQLRVILDSYTGYVTILEWLKINLSRCKVQHVMYRKHEMHIILFKY